MVGAKALGTAWVKPPLVQILVVVANKNCKRLERHSLLAYWPTGTGQSVCSPHKEGDCDAERYSTARHIRGDI